MNTQSDSKNELGGVFKKIQEIVEKSADGDYIYRGEPEHYQVPLYYGKVSSTLYRHLKTVWIMGFDLDIEEFQKRVLNDAREHIHEAVNDFELLTKIQHYGGKTNLIDFTEDYHIALFFACDSYYGEDGRVVLQKRDEIKELVENPRRPIEPISRVIAQKSIFIRPRRGFITPNSENIVDIQANLKSPMLDYLWKYHKISTKTIYNDLHGFIRTQRIRDRAYEEFYHALILGKQGEPQEAISHYTNPLELDPLMDATYYNRGLTFADMGQFDKAIRDLNTFISRNLEDADAYKSRGDVHLQQNRFDKAIRDYSKAIDLKSGNLFIYCDRAWVCEVHTLI